MKFSVSIIFVSFGLLAVMMPALAISPNSQGTHQQTLNQQTEENETGQSTVSVQELVGEANLRGSIGRSFSRRMRMPSPVQN